MMQRNTIIVICNTCTNFPIQTDQVLKNINLMVYNGKRSFKDGKSFKQISTGEGDMQVTLFFFISSPFMSIWKKDNKEEICRTLYYVLFQQGKPEQHIEFALAKSLVLALMAEKFYLQKMELLFPWWHQAILKLTKTSISNKIKSSEWFWDHYAEMACPAWTKPITLF